MFPSLVLVASAVIYSVYTWLYYHPGIVQTPVVWLGVALALVANILWIYLARYVGDPGRMMFWTLACGLIIDAAGIIVPVVFFAVRPSPMAWAGIAVTVAGLAIIKVASSQA